MALEEAFTNIARASGKPSVIICDRGVCDNRAFVSKSDWELILDVENFKLIDLRDKYATLPTKKKKKKSTNH
jgi:hypothetical protein